MIIKKRWNLLQSEQIELGHSGGLSKKQIALYAKKKYNFLQMQEIRTALMNGADPSQVKAMCRRNLSHEQMEEIRKRLENGETVYTPPDLRYITAAAALAVFTGALAFSGYLKAGDHIDLQIKEDTVILEEGDVFDPVEYIESYSQDADRLSLPYDVDTETAGRKAAVYRLSKGREEIVRILIVEVQEQADHNF